MILFFGDSSQRFNLCRYFCAFYRSFVSPFSYAILLAPSFTLIFSYYLILFFCSVLFFLSLLTFTFYFHAYFRLRAPFLRFRNRRIFCLTLFRSLILPYYFFVFFSFKIEQWHWGIFLHAHDAFHLFIVIFGNFIICIDF